MRQNKGTATYLIPHRKNYNNNSSSTCCTAISPGGPGLAGTRMFPFWI